MKSQPRLHGIKGIGSDIEVKDPYEHVTDTRGVTSTMAVFDKRQPCNETRCDESGLSPDGLRRKKGPVVTSQKESDLSRRSSPSIYLLCARPPVCCTNTHSARQIQTQQQKAAQDILKLTGSFRSDRKNSRFEGVGRNHIYRQVITCRQDQLRRSRLAPRN